MIRSRLFLYFVILAWVSVFKPSEGNYIIDCSNVGMRFVKRKRGDGASVALWLAFLLAMAIVASWLGWLVYMAVVMVAGA